MVAILPSTAMSRYGILGVIDPEETCMPISAEATRARNFILKYCDDYNTVHSVLYH